MIICLLRHIDSPRRRPLWQATSDFTHRCGSAHNQTTAARRSSPLCTTRRATPKSAATSSPSSRATLVRPRSLCLAPFLVVCKKPSLLGNKTHFSYLSLCGCRMAPADLSAAEKIEKMKASESTAHAHTHSHGACASVEPCACRARLVTSTLVLPGRRVSAGRRGRHGLS